MTPLGGSIQLEIPTSVPEPPAGAGWIHEIKYDGYRTLIVIDQGKVRAYSRPGRDWTGPYRRVVDACANLGCKAALIDGEVVVQDEQGISDFDALRSAIHKARHRLVLFAFDLLHLDGEDLRRTPLLEGQRHTSACHGECVRHRGLDPKSVSILPMPEILR
jgi:bifunctional non-homologous end joining protein LigD